MRGQEREEEFLKGNVGEQIRLHFRDKHYKIDLVFIQLACNK